MSVILPLSETPPAEVCDYLLTQGMSREVIAWKYFDADFNRGRNRGWVWMADGEVHGFLGQIPFQIGRGDLRYDAHWFTDWSVDETQRNTMSGLRLLSHAIASCAQPMSVGGNDTSTPILERIAEHTDLTATSEYRRVLRFAPLTRGIGRRLPWLNFLQAGWLGRMPVTRLRVTGGSPMTHGVAPEIAALLQEAPAQHWAACYDLEFLRWQIGRCPGLRSLTIMDQKHDPQMAVVAWTQEPGSLWRMVFWQREPSNFAVAERVLVDSLAHLLRLGAAEVSCMISRWDSDAAAALSGAGFRDAGFQRPLYFFDGPEGSLRLRELQRVHFLAADIGHRF